MTETTAPALPYQHESPWLKLGHDITTATTVEEALRAAGLDWTISLHDMYYNKENLVDRPDFDITVPVGDRFVHVPQRRVVVRDQDHLILGTVGTAYQPLQNHEAFSVLDVAVKEFGVRFVAGGAYGPAQRAWLLASLPETAQIVDGDHVYPYFLVSTGHDGATPYLATPTPYRPICGNSVDLAYSAGFKDCSFRLTHVKSAAERLEQVKDMVEAMLTAFKNATDLFKRMAATKINRVELEEYVNDVLGIEPGDQVKGVIERRRARILELAESGKGATLAYRTVWTAYNAVTEYVDHVRPAEATEKSRQSANEAALFGRMTLLKARALNLARALV